jgi:hypothetical protein
VTKLIQIFSRDAFHDMRADHIQHLGRQSASYPHFFDLFSGFAGDALRFLRGSLKHWISICCGKSPDKNVGLVNDVADWDRACRVAVQLVFPNNPCYKAPALMANLHSI